MAKPFLSNLKQNISSRFESHDIVSAFSILDPRKIPTSSSQLSTYGQESVEVLIGHYAQERPALMLNDEETTKEGLFTTEMRTEWITYRNFLIKKHEDTTSNQLEQLITNDMLKTMFPNLSQTASIGLTIPVSTASVERSFSKMKLIKTRLRNSLSEASLSQLMRITMEAPETLTKINDDLDSILDIWNRKPRRIVI